MNSASSKGVSRGDYGKNDRQGRNAGDFGRDRPGQVGRGGSAFSSRAMHNPMRDAAFGTGVRGSPFAGMGGLNARRTPGVSPSYQGTLGNFAKLGMMGAGMMLGGGPLTAVGMMGKPLGRATGVLGGLTGFSGYTGLQHGPGSYDPTNRGPADRAGYNPFDGRPKMQPAQSPQPAQAAQPAITLASIMNRFRSIPGPSAYGVYTPFLS